MCASQKVRTLQPTLSWFATSKGSISHKNLTGLFFVLKMKALIKKTRIKLKFMFSRKATKIDKIFTVDLTLCSKRQIDGEDFVNFRGLLRKYELYLKFSQMHSLFC